MVTKIKNGTTVLVDIKLEFTGTIRSYLITVENQHIPTINDEAEDIPITIDGDPIRIHATFLASKGSCIKKFEISINKITGFKIADLNFKSDEITMTSHVPYSEFKLKQI